jgi:hypothetical protein
MNVEELIKFIGYFIRALALLLCVFSFGLLIYLLIILTINVSYWFIIAIIGMFAFALALLVYLNDKYVW